MGGHRIAVVTECTGQEKLVVAGQMADLTSRERQTKEWLVLSRTYCEGRLVQQWQRYDGVMVRSLGVASSGSPADGRDNERASVRSTSLPGYNSSCCPSLLETQPPW